MGSFDAAGAGLVEVIASEFSALADYSRLLWRAAYEPHLFPPDVSERLWSRSYSRPALDAAHASGEKTFWVMMEGHRAGFVAYRLERASHQMRLSKIYLHPDYWGRGLGGWVLQSMTDVGLRSGVRYIDLYVFRRNTRAVRAYQRAGFRIAREELTDLGEGVIYDDFVMVKEISSRRAP
jgi:ribosomal protein S18 acetylase RimI-like enzyme